MRITLNKILVLNILQPENASKVFGLMTKTLDLFIYLFIF